MAFVAVGVGIANTTDQAGCALKAVGGTRLAQIGVKLGIVASRASSETLIGMEVVAIDA